MNEDLKNKIISAAYGDAGRIDKISVWLLIKRNSECKTLFDEYKKTAASVHKIKLERCPDDLVANAFKIVDEEIKNSPKSFAGFFRNPVLTTAAALIILAALIFTFNETGRQTEKQYSQSEILKADQQVKSSLVVISRLLNQTTKKLEEEILPKKVGKPIQQGFEIINQLFPKGKSNENS